MNYETLNKLRKSDIKYKKLIEKIAKLSNKKIEKLFIQSVQNGDVDTMNFLIANSIDRSNIINCSNKKGVTALMIACANQDLEMVKVLLANGADPNLADAQGFDLSIAQSESLPFVKKYWNQSLQFDGYEHLWHRKGGLTAMIYTLCVREPNIKILEELIKHGAKVNTQDNEGFSSLMYTVENGQLEAAKCLIKHGANVNAQDIYGNSILLHATTKMYVKNIVPTLIFAGADPKVANMFGDNCYSVKTANMQGKQEIDESIKLMRVAKLLKVAERKEVKYIEHKEEKLDDYFNTSNDKSHESIMA